jgi:hypothetical protein
VVLLEFSGFASQLPGLVNGFVLGRVAATGTERGRVSGVHLVHLGREYAHRAAETTRDVRRSFPSEEGHDHQERDDGVRAFEEISMAQRKTPFVTAAQDLSGPSPIVTDGCGGPRPRAEQSESTRRHGTRRGRE